jgi:hypothetical protein
VAKLPFKVWMIQTVISNDHILICYPSLSWNSPLLWTMLSLYTEEDVTADVKYFLLITGLMVFKSEVMLQDYSFLDSMY